MTDDENFAILYSDTNYSNKFYEQPYCHNAIKHSKEKLQKEAIEEMIEDNLTERKNESNKRRRYPHLESLGYEPDSHVDEKDEGLRLQHHLHHGMVRQTSPSIDRRWYKNSKLKRVGEQWERY